MPAKLSLIIFVRWYKNIDNGELTVNINFYKENILISLRNEFSSS